MNSKTRAPRWLWGAGRLAVFALMAAGVSACSDVLTVEDPDILEPADVQSAAGADAVRLGTIARLNAATSGGGDVSDNLFLLGGLFADEWINGDSFIARQEIDQRVITPENNFLTAASRTLNRARLGAEQALALLAQHNPGAPGWHFAEMHFVQAYTVNLLAEHLCSGLVFSSVVDGEEQYGSPITTTAAFERALRSAEDGLARITGTTADDIRVRNVLQVTRGRILMNLNRPADAAAAVAGVPTNFRYRMFHAQARESNRNVIVTRNNVNRRYSVGNREGGNGLNFATAGDPRVPVCVGGDPACRAIGVTNNRRDDLLQPFHVQMIWTREDSAVTIVGGIEARMIEAEAQLRAGSTAYLTTLNAARATVTGLAPLVLPATSAERVDQIFRERAFWLFSRGHRVGDLRRLVRQYGRATETVFPTGAWHKNDARYGTDVTIPVPAAEANNPNPGSGVCLSRAA
ncbi:MAG TPA: hypothetical protein VF584_19755 [Longimicrobium sp.]